MSDAASDAYKNELEAQYARKVGQLEAMLRKHPLVVFYIDHSSLILKLLHGSATYAELEGLDKALRDYETALFPIQKAALQEGINKAMKNIDDAQMSLKNIAFSLKK